MSTPINSSALAASIASTEAYNAYHDIVWSLYYMLSGNPTAQAGICTFLYDANTTHTKGGIGASLGIAPSQGYTGFTNISGISGNALAIGFDTHGLFAVQGNGLSSGVPISAAIPNAITLRTGTNFTYLTSIALTALDPSFSLVHSDLTFDQLRFRLTDIGRTLEIARWNLTKYEVLLTYPVNLPVDVGTSYKTGISFSTPLCGDATSAKFALRNFHIEGIQTAPTEGVSDPSIFYSLPIVNNIDIAAPNSIDIIPQIQQLEGIYSPIEPPAPASNPCDASPVPNASCGDYINYSGASGTFYYYIDAGTGVGDFTIDYESYTIPDRFTLTWNGKSTTTCFVGDSSYNAQLSALGFGPVSGNGTGSLKIAKTSASPSMVELRVDGPLEGTAWNVGVRCLVVPDPSLEVYSGISTSPSNRIYPGGSYSFGTANIGSKNQAYFTLKNAGEGTLNTINILQSLLSTFGEFQINPFITTSTLSPSQTASFGVIFAPSNTDIRYSEIQVYSNDMRPGYEPFIISLNGYGVGASTAIYPCNTTIPYQTGPSEYFVEFGTRTGEMIINYNVPSKPDRFTLYWNGISATSGFVGNSSFSSQLTAIGYPSVVGSGVGVLSAMKTLAHPTYAKVVVEDPLLGQNWSTFVECIYGS